MRANPRFILLGCALLAGLLVFSHASLDNVPPMNIHKKDHVGEVSLLASVDARVAAMQQQLSEQGIKVRWLAYDDMGANIDGRHMSASKLLYLRSRLPCSFLPCVCALCPFAVEPNDHHAPRQGLVYSRIPRPVLLQ